MKERGRKRGEGGSAPVRENDFSFRKRDAVNARHLPKRASAWHATRPCEASPLDIPAHVKEPEEPPAFSQKRFRNRSTRGMQKWQLRERDSSLH